MRFLKNEADWVYLPLSEERVVAKQIKNRSRQDASYQAKQNGGQSLATEGGFGLAESVQCTYIDLDRQIERCSLSDEQRQLLQMQMDGYSLRDIAETLNVEHGIVERAFRNAVTAIVRQNNLQWRQIHGKACAEVVD